VQGTLIDFDTQMKWKTDALSQILERTTEKGQDATIGNIEYLRAFGFDGPEATAADLWKHILAKILNSGNQVVQHWRKELDVILNEGTLSKRLMSALGDQPSQEKIVSVYKQLAGCLAQNKMFLS
jgi:hypothetical protein